MNNEITIDGVVYVKKEVPEKKREPIKAWAHIFSNGVRRFGEKTAGHDFHVADVLECVELHEVPKDSKVISKDDITDAWFNKGFGMNYINDFLKALGFDGKEEV